MVLVPIPYGVTGSRKSNMATTKPAIFRSSPVDVINKIFQRLHPCFGGTGKSMALIPMPYVRYYWKWEVQHGDHQTGNIQIFARNSDTNEIPMDVNSRCMILLIYNPI
jgi:hypothetical protein